MVFGKEGVREIDPGSFYMVSLLRGQLNSDAEQAYFQYIMEQGIYYIYHQNIFQIPKVFDSMTTIYYLIAIRLISIYAHSKTDLAFLRVWLDDNRSITGTWEMPNLKPDGFVFPRSDNWRKYENKVADINDFINEVLEAIEE